MFDCNLDSVEKTVLSRSMNFSGGAKEVQQKKEIYEIAVKTAIQVLKECARSSSH